ncbi:MAG TPA: Uma2 family endonuclease [Candidatus Elarobacter sp.]|jgi:Uma2 family endonuclease
MLNTRSDHPITVDEYHRMVETGRLREGDRVELLNGRLIAVPPTSPPHAGSSSALLALFFRNFGDRAHIGSQSPVVLDDWSEPEPDVVVSRTEPGRYMTRHPTPADVLLVVEVSRSTLRFDRGEKLAAYARCAIAEVWIVDLVHHRLETYAEPAGETYRVRSVYGRADRVSARAFPADSIAIADFMP